MKASIFATVISLIVCALSVAQDKQQLNDYQIAYAEWESEQSVTAYGKLQDAWRTASQFERDHAAYYYALAAVTTAAQATKEDAYLLLREAGRVASEYPIVLSRGKSATRFQEVASVHSKVWGASKTDPFEGAPVGYEMTPNENGFVALQESPEIGPTMPLGAESLLEANEGLGLLLSFDSTGSILQQLFVAITEGSGPLRSRLKAVLKHQPAGPDGPSRFSRQVPSLFFAEQPSTKTTPTLSPPSPTPQPPTRQVKTPEAKPTPTPSEEPTSSTPWSIIVVLIVAATGLLWLLVKNRK